MQHKNLIPFDMHVFTHLESLSGFERNEKYLKAVNFSLKKRGVA